MFVFFCILNHVSCLLHLALLPLSHDEILNVIVDFVLV